jgi:hypothetical protein
VPEDLQLEFARRSPAIPAPTIYIDLALRHAGSFSRMRAANHHNSPTPRA